MGDPLSVLLELGDETRLRVLTAVLRARKNVSSIVSELGLSQPQVSYHLRKLKSAGLVVEEKDGRWVWYQANREADDRHVRELLDYLTRWSGGARESSAPARSTVKSKGGSEDELEDFLL